MKSRLVVSDISPGGLFERFVFPIAFRERIHETRFKQDWRLTKFEFACLKMGWDGEGDPKQWLTQFAKAFNGPKKQRGSIILSAFGVQTGAAPSGSVALTNHTLSSVDLGNLVTSRAAFLTTGVFSHTDDGVPTAVASGEWHSDEPSTTGANYEVRYTSASKTGSSYTNPAAAGDTWIRIDLDRSWGHRIVAKSSPSAIGSGADFELGDYLASSADDSGNITITAEN